MKKIYKIFYEKENFSKIILEIQHFFTKEKRSKVVKYFFFV